AGAADDLLQLPGPGRVAPEPALDRGPYLLRNVQIRVQGAVVQVADQVLLALVASPGEVDQGAGVGGDDHADLARQAEAQGEVILRRGVLDLADAGRHAVQPADDALLHGGRQPGDRPAGDAGLGARLLPVAGQLYDGPQPHRLVVAEGLQAP